jgi:predicted phage terminase large subunit-like protein
MDLWNEWERIYCDLDNPTHIADARAFYEAHREAMHAGADVLWPEEEDLYALMRIRVESGRTAFNREKQSRPIDPERCEWPEEYFSGEIWFDDWPEGMLFRAIALDPSKGAAARNGDYSAYALVGVGSCGLLYVDADLARRATPDIVTDGLRLVEEFRPEVFGVEANQFQELLADEFTAAFATARMWRTAISKIDNRTPKALRIRRLGRYLSQRKIRFKRRSPGVRLLVDQLRDFPLASHDDGPDALEMALRLTDESLRSRVQPSDGLGSTLVEV